MKKLVLLAILSISAITGAFAQSFTSQYGDTAIVNYSGPGMDIAVYNKIKSNINGDIYLKWRVIDKNIPTDWSFIGMCDNNICWPPSVLNGGAYVSNAYGSSFGDFHAIFNGDAASMGSVAWIKVQANDTSNFYSHTYVFVATKFAAGVSTVVKAEDDVALYPNPARNNVNVVFDAGLNVKNVAIYNMIGKAVKVFRVAGNSAKMDINDIPAGIYFVRLVNAQGQIVATRKFTHQ